MGTNGLNIGIFGGTFNPIHNGHLISAEAIHSDFNLDRIIFVPSNYTVKKETDVLAPAEDRYAMTVLATRGIKEFEVSCIELEHVGPSYTIKTVEKLRGLYQESGLYLIIGIDALDSIKNWRDSARLMELVSLIVMRRPTPVPMAAHDLSRHNAIYANNPLVDISSTNIRERLSNGKSVKYLLPDSVIEYIQNRKLYAEK